MSSKVKFVDTESGSINFIIARGTRLPSSKFPHERERHHVDQADQISGQA